MIPTDGLTHTMMLSYHAGIEDDLPDPRINADEVEQEILLDEWTHLQASNGEIVRGRKGRALMLDEEPEV